MENGGIRPATRIPEMPVPPTRPAHADCKPAFGGTNGTLRGIIAVGRSGHPPALGSSAHLDGRGGSLGVIRTIRVVRLGLDRGGFCAASILALSLARSPSEKAGGFVWRLARSLATAAARGRRSLFAAAQPASASVQVRKMRRQQRLTQPALAARCQVLGYDLSRESLSKIEARLRSVSDAEVLLLAEALKVPCTLLFPDPEQMKAAVRPFKRK